LSAMQPAETFGATAREVGRRIGRPGVGRRGPGAPRSPRHCHIGLISWESMGPKTLTFLRGRPHPEAWDRTRLHEKADGCG
jgi:hypothetical protein